MNGKTRRFALLALLALAAGLALAACGSGGGSAYGGESSGSSSNAGAGAAAVSTGTASGAGQVLVDSEGLTLYYFEKDKQGGVSTCGGACAEAWPPLTTEGAPTAAGGVKSSLLGTIERSDGTTQVTYAGRPLYTFVSDRQPGEDNGTDSDAFGAPWYPIHANGEKAGE